MSLAIQHQTYDMAQIRCSLEWQCDGAPYDSDTWKPLDNFDLDFASDPINIHIRLVTEITGEIKVFNVTKNRYFTRKKIINEFNKT